MSEKEEGELKKRIRTEANVGGVEPPLSYLEVVEKILDEAKQEYPTVTKILSMNEQGEITFNYDLCDRWFKKWFGDSP